MRPPQAFIPMNWTASPASSHMGPTTFRFRLNPRKRVRLDLDDGISTDRDFRMVLSGSADVTIVAKSNAKIHIDDENQETQGEAALVV